MEIRFPELERMQRRNALASFARRFIFVAFLFVLYFLVHCCGEARASPVDAATVCAVRAALHPVDRWDGDKCAAIATAMNTADDPVELLAMSVVESDVRPDSWARSSETVFDIGLLGIRCVLSKGVRGVLAPGPALPTQSRKLPSGRCTNGPARGLTLRQLQDPVVNVRVAIALIARKKHHFGDDWRRAYNGGTTENGYAGRVRVVRAAILGIERRTNDKRARGLARKILKEVRKELETS